MSLVQKANQLKEVLMPLTRDADVIGRETHVVVQRAEVKAERRKKAKMAKMASKAIAELLMVKKNHANADSVEEAVQVDLDHVADMEAEAEIIDADCQNATEQRRKAMEQRENPKANALEDHHEMEAHLVAVDSVVLDPEVLHEEAVEMVAVQDAHAKIMALHAVAAVVMFQ